MQSQRPSFAVLRERLVVLVSDALVHLKLDKAVTLESFPVAFKRAESALTDNDRTYYASTQDPAVAPTYDDPLTFAVNAESAAEMHMYEYAPPPRKIMHFDMAPKSEEEEEDSSAYLSFVDL
jgi:hypothetical protein